MGKKELFDCTLAMFVETDKAILVAETEETPKDKRQWLPKSQIEYRRLKSEMDWERSKDGVRYTIVEVTLPVWLAEEKGFV